MELVWSFVSTTSGVTFPTLPGFKWRIMHMEVDCSAYVGEVDIYINSLLYGKLTSVGNSFNAIPGASNNLGGGMTAPANAGWFSDQSFIQVKNNSASTLVVLVAVEIEGL